MDLPVPSSTKPFWHRDSHELSSHRSTEKLPESQDVLIIGAGFTGAASAYYMTRAQNPPAQLTILEARDACSGATGRNGGHVRPDSMATFAKFGDILGLDLANEIAQFEIDNTDAVRELVQDLGIDCDLEQIGSANAYLDEAMAEAARQQLESLVDAGYEVAKRFKYHDQTTAAEVTGVAGAKGATTFPASCVWPYKLVMALLSAAVQKGVNLQTNTPVLSISDTPDADGNWIVSTPRGTTKAKKILLATNGYTRQLLPEYTGLIIPVRGICSHIQAAESGKMPALSSSVRTMGIKHSPGCQDYLISRPDGSIVVGGAWKVVRPGPKEDWHNVTDDSKLIPGAETYYDGYMERTFAPWAETKSEVDYLWTGIMGYTSDSLPHVGPVQGKPGLFVSAGFNGHGMPQVLLCAKGAVKMVLDGCDFAETGVPSVFRTGSERLLE